MIDECSSCGAKTPVSSTGDTHRYLGASPGCWARFGEVLAHEYSDPLYFSVHALTVDAYAVQHPGQESPQTISSINVHLVSLYAHYRDGVTLDELPQLKARMTKRKDLFRWLHPPENLGRMTINDIWKATSAEMHRDMVTQWGEIALDCWSNYHEYLRHISAVVKTNQS